MDFFLKFSNKSKNIGKKFFMVFHLLNILCKFLIRIRFEFQKFQLQIYESKFGIQKWLCHIYKIFSSKIK